MKMKTIALALIVCLMVTLLPAAALAAGEDESIAKVIGTSWTVFGQSVDYTYQGKTYTSADAPPAINRAAFRSMSEEDKQTYAQKIYDKSERVAQLGDTGNNELMAWWRSTNQYSAAMRQVSTTITERKFPALGEFYTVEEGQDWRKHYTLEALTNSSNNPTVMADNQLIAAALLVQETRDELDDAWSAGLKAYESIQTVQREKIRDSWNVGSYLVNVTFSSDQAHVLLTLRADSSFTGGLLSLLKGSEVLGGTELTAGMLTLSRAGNSYFGQAPGGAVVSLCDADSGRFLRSVTAVHGFFRIPEEGGQPLAIRSGSAQRVQVVCSSAGQTLYSNTVSTTAANLASVAVAGHDLSFNSQLGCFCDYLYPQEEPVSISAVFTASVTVEAAAVEFAGNIYPATVADKTVTAAINSDSSGYGSKELTLLLDGEPYALAWLTLLPEPSGVVKDKDHMPIAGAQAVCMVLENNIWQKWDAASFGQINPQITADDGSFGWSLPTGNYRILVSCDGYQSYDSLSDYPEGVTPPLNTVNIVLNAHSVPIITDGDAHIRIIAPTTGVPGETTTVRLIPDVGYMLNDYTASDSVSHAMVKLNPTSNGYSFIMPENPVTITAASTLSRTGLISKVEPVSGGANVTVSLGNLENKSLMIAAYDANGKMLGVYIGNAENGSYFFSYNGTADKISAFVLDPVTLAPQLEKITPNPPQTQ